MPRLFASAGIYPHSTPEADDAAIAKLDGLLAQPEVIACGEIGLDYYHEGAAHDVQRAGLIRQLEIAAARKRPILIHCRPKDGAVDAWNERKHGPTRALVAGPQAYVEHAIDRGGVNADADFTCARLGVRHALVFEHLRRAVVVDDDRFHAQALTNVAAKTNCANSEQL